MLPFDETSNSYKLVCGIDEVGRGPLAGPVVAAAVVLDPDKPIDGIEDSKRLQPERRVVLAESIREHSAHWSLGRAEVEEIEQLNILQATMLAMRRAFRGLRTEVDIAYIDGNSDPGLDCRSVTVIKGDAKFACIGAASIIAKVARDREMQSMAKLFPEYGFESNKGYPTPAHLDALRKFGPCRIHRSTFAPVATALHEQRELTESGLEIAP